MAQDKYFSSRQPLYFGMQEKYFIHVAHCVTSNIKKVFPHWLIFKILIFLHQKHPLSGTGFVCLFYCKCIVGENIMTTSCLVSLP